MFETLLGAEMPLAVRFFLAFLIVLGLIGATAWAVRRFGTGRLGANARGRQPRLAVIDYASVDGRRRLILVRRDNVEHLLMIGGPTDVVVEPNIVRAQPREVPSARPTAGVEALPRAIPLPETGSAWPLQPEPTGGPRPRLEPLPEEAPRAYHPTVEAPPRAPRDTLAALAEELSTRAASMPRSRTTTVPEPETAEEEAALEALPEPRGELRPEPRQETRPEPRQEARPEPRVEARPESRLSPRKPIAPVAPPVPPASPPLEPTPDQAISDMAQRLEAALRKPSAEPRSPATPRSGPSEPPSEPTPRSGRLSEPKPSRPETKPKEGKTLYDNLEQEMASLLGRQTKT